METKVKKRSPGRPVGSGKLTKEITEELCKSLEMGVTIKAACARTGIGEKTFHTWMDKGRNAKKGSVYWHFRQHIEKSKATCLAMLEVTVNRMARPHDEVTERQQINPKTGEIVTLTDVRKNVVDSALAKFILERRHPDLYGRKDKVDLTSGDKPLTFSVFGQAIGSEGEVEE